jgi:hypothetical protein
MFFILYTFIELSDVLYNICTSFILPYIRLSYDIHTTFIQVRVRVVCDGKTNSGSTFFHGSVFCSLCTGSSVADGGLVVEEMVVMVMVMGMVVMMVVM